MKVNLKRLSLGVALLVVSAVAAYQAMPSFADDSKLSITQVDRPFLSELRGATFHVSSRSRDGGIYLSGSSAKTQALFAKIDSTGKVMWTRRIEQQPLNRGLSAFDSSDGGSWGIGYGWSRDVRAEEDARRGTGTLKPYEIYKLQGEAEYQYLLKMDSSGKPLTKSQLTSGEAHFVQCGIDTGDGLVFIGRAHVAYRSAYGVPWVEKTDYDGKVLWETTIARDGDELLDTPGADCRGLNVTDSGMIVWAGSVQPRTLKRVDGEDVLVDENSLRAPFNTIVFMLDQSGKEIHRIRRKDADVAYLFPAANGYSLVEHYQPHIPDSVRSLPMITAIGLITQITNTDGGIRVTKLDTALQVLKTDDYKIPAFNRQLGAVVSRRAGEYFFAGCNKDSVQAVAYLNTDRNKVEVSNVFPPGKRINQCALFSWLSIASNDDLLLSAASEQDGDRLLAIRRMP